MGKTIVGRCVYNGKPITCSGQCATDCPFFNGELDTPTWQRKLHGGSLANLGLVGVNARRKALERKTK